MPTDTKIPVISVGKITAKVEAPQAVYEHLDEMLATSYPAAEHMMGSRPGWDGKWHPFDILRGTFPAGLLHRVRRILPQARIVWRYRRSAPMPFNPNVIRGVSLHEHQIEAIKAALERGRGILDIVMGGMKTVIAMGIILHVRGKGIVMVPKKDLLHQWKDEILAKTGEEAALIGDGSWDGRAADPGIKFVVAMPQTAIRDLDEWRRCTADATTIIIDEAHTTGGAKTFYRVAQMVAADYRIGLSATPDTDNDVTNLRLEATTGPVIYRKKGYELVARKLLVPCRYVLHKVINPAVFGDWNTVRRCLIERNTARNEAIVRIVLDAVREGKRYLVICDTIPHIRLITDRLRGEAAVNVRSITGSNRSYERLAGKRELRSGRLDVIVTTVFGEGTDIPELDGIILGSCHRSTVRFLQRCGRVFRNAKGKVEGVVHDFFDTGHRNTTLHSTLRIEMAKRERFTITGGFPITGTPARPRDEDFRDVDESEDD